MTPTELVVIDTCIWVPFFNRPRSAEKTAVDALLDEDRVAISGPILTEILQGFRRKDQADWVASVLRGLHYLEITWDDWRAAAELGRHLAGHGHRLPLTDLVVAVVAFRLNAAVYTSDPHFNLIPHLKRFSPG